MKMYTGEMICEITEINEQICVEYEHADGSKIRLLMPGQIEIVDVRTVGDFLVEDGDDVENEDAQTARGLKCSSCDSDLLALVRTFDLDFVIDHIETCLGLEPKENDEGDITVIQYS